MGGLVIFDLDGVLVDSSHAITSAMNDALAARGLATREPQALRRFIGPPLTEAFAELSGTEVHGEVVEGLVAGYREVYRVTSVVRSRVYDGVAEALGELGAGATLAVATSKARPLAVELLEGLGLAPHFALIEGPALSARAEPKAVTIGRVLAQLLAPRPAVMIGDRSHDAVGAAANGLPCLGAQWGFGGEEELRAAGVSALVRTPAELPGAVHSLLRRG